MEMERLVATENFSWEGWEVRLKELKKFPKTCKEAKGKTRQEHCTPSFKWSDSPEKRSSNNWKFSSNMWCIGKICANLQPPLGSSLSQCGQVCYFLKLVSKWAHVLVQNEPVPSIWFCWCSLTMIMLDEEWEVGCSSNAYLLIIKGIRQIPFQSCFIFLLTSRNTSQGNTGNQKSKTGFTPFLQGGCSL